MKLALSHLSDGYPIDSGTSEKQLEANYIGFVVILMKQDNKAEAQAVVKQSLAIAADSMPAFGTAHRHNARSAYGVIQGPHRNCATFRSCNMVGLPRAWTCPEIKHAGELLDNAATFQARDCVENATTLYCGSWPPFLAVTRQSSSRSGS